MGPYSNFVKYLIIQGSFEADLGFMVGSHANSYTPHYALYSLYMLYSL